MGLSLLYSPEGLNKNSFYIRKGNKETDKEYRVGVINGMTVTSFLPLLRTTSKQDNKNPLPRDHKR